MGQTSEEFQKFLDSQQYTKNGILRYERIFGGTYISTGGKQTTEKFCCELKLTPDMKILDVGCGIGGSAFHMAREYGALVHGIDLSQNMIDIAQEYRNKMEPGVKHRVQFHVEDATTMDYPESFYDVIYSRDTILHIEDKSSLFKKFYRSLKPGGVLFITDYCRGDQEHSQRFKDYVKQRGYNLLTVKEYGQVIEGAGFGKVNAMDNTPYFCEILKRELSEFEPKKAEMIRDYTEHDYDDICRGWKEKLVRCDDGDQVWGYFYATKLFV